MPKPKLLDLSQLTRGTAGPRTQRPKPLDLRAFTRSRPGASTCGGACGCSGACSCSGGCGCRGNPPFVVTRAPAAATAAAARMARPLGATAFGGVLSEETRRRLLPRDFFVFINPHRCCEVSHHGAVFWPVPGTDSYNIVTLYTMAVMALAGRSDLRVVPEEGLERAEEQCDAINRFIRDYIDARSSGLALALSDDELDCLASYPAILGRTAPELTVTVPRIYGTRSECEALNGGPGSCDDFGREDRRWPWRDDLQHSGRPWPFDGMTPRALDCAWSVCTRWCGDPPSVRRRIRRFPPIT